MKSSEWTVCCVPCAGLLRWHCLCLHLSSTHDCHLYLSPTIVTLLFPPKLRGSFAGLQDLMVFSTTTASIIRCIRRKALLTPALGGVDEPKTAMMLW